MIRRSSHPTGSVLILAVGLLACSLPLISRADTIQWNSPTPYYRLGHPNTIATWGLSNIITRVEYRAGAYDADTGATIPCGTSVPGGTNIAFRFNPHASTDVYWFGTGYNADSPYGDWAAGGGLPPGNLCVPKNLVQEAQKHTSKYYGTLSVAPPTKTVANVPSGCTTESDGSSKRCVMNASGIYDVRFVFGTTTGKFYGTGGFFGGDGQDKQNGPLYCWNAPLLALQNLETTTQTSNTGGSLCIGNTCRCSSKGCYSYSYTVSTPVPATFTVPEQSISCKITVTDAPPGANPTAPSLRGPGSTGIGNGGTCTVGTPYTLSFSASSPQGTALRYGVDWNADGSVDQFVPPSGYVSSGTTQTATRTFTTAGSKTVKVFAQDQNGLASSWSSLSFTCNPVAEQQLVDDGVPDDGSGIGIDDGPGASQSPDLVLRAVPSVVKRGSSATVTWSATKVASCTVSGSNGDSWTGKTSPVGGEQTSAINRLTTYTLACLDASGNRLTRTTTVSILPSWQEQ